MSLPSDYLERVYAGVLGKLIGVYLGRPFEGWTYDKIMHDLGPIEYYVNDKTGDPLVVTDDDVAGTFTFIRALEDYALSQDLTAEQIGKSWLNYIVENRSILWWGGKGNSTEHTAWLNLRNGIPAPQSGSILTNGQTVAEQIGAQIFIDGWAMVCPGKPETAAQFAQKAGRVSHDGESVHAAMMWAAMEAEAFKSADVEHLLDTGLAQIPSDCALAKMIADVRMWHRHFYDWHACRQQIQEQYGYQKYHGHCHVMPNHAIMIMALLYAGDDFSKGQMIINTSGWDTDCNAGNLGCLQGIMLGLDGINKGPDWRGPIGDRMLISSADGGNAINDAVRMAYYLANLGRQLDGLPPLSAAKDGAQFHFSLPGSTQGFAPCDVSSASVTVENINVCGEQVLSVGVMPNQRAVVTTPTFTPPNIDSMRVYELMATPLLYPGQQVSAQVCLPDSSGPCLVCLCLRRYGADDQLVLVTGDQSPLAPGESKRLEWRLPDCGGQPIAEVGLVVEPLKDIKTNVFLEYLKWVGTPELTLLRPEETGTFWRRAWVNNVDVFSKWFPQGFHISNESADGLIIHGTNQWENYTVTAEVVTHLGTHAGLAARVQGLRRYYAALITRDGFFKIVRVRDDQMSVLSEAPFDMQFDVPVTLSMTVKDNIISASANSTSLSVEDLSDTAILCGGIGLVIASGAASADVIRVDPIK